MIKEELCKIENSVETLCSVQSKKQNVNDFEKEKFSKQNVTKYYD